MPRSWQSCCEWMACRSEFMWLRGRVESFETDHPIQPRVVWFKERVHGQKCGILMWCDQAGSRYRCGIWCVSCTQIEEDYFRNLIGQVQPSKPVQDTDWIITRLNGCIQKNWIGTDTQHPALSIGSHGFINKWYNCNMTKASIYFQVRFLQLNLEKHSDYTSK